MPFHRSLTLSLVSSTNSIFSWAWLNYGFENGYTAIHEEFLIEWFELRSSKIKQIFSSGKNSIRQQNGQINNVKKQEKPTTLQSPFNYISLMCFFFISRTLFLCLQRHFLSPNWPHLLRLPIQMCKLFSSIRKMDSFACLVPKEKVKWKQHVHNRLVLFFLFFIFSELSSSVYIQTIPRKVWIIYYSH